MFCEFENVQIIFQKTVDLGLVFWDSCFTHGNTKHNKLVKMRTQKLLITAAAALVAGIVSSQAQVYSQNIVGYVNTILPNGNTAISNPLLNGDGTNGAENVLTSLQIGDGLLVWNGAGYSGYTYGGPGAWLDQNGNPTSQPTLAPATPLPWPRPGRMR